MWLLRGDLREHQANDLSIESEEQFTIYLRPGAVYTIGRQHKDSVVDFSWAEPKSASRKHVELQTSAADPHSLIATSGSCKPTYSLKVTNLSKKSWPVQRGDGRQESIAPNIPFQVSSGDTVIFVAPHRQATFLWRAVDLFFPNLRKPAEVALLSAYTGWRYMDSKSRLSDEQPFTHIFVKTVKQRAHLAEAAVKGLPIVNMEFFQQLRRVVRPRKELPKDDKDFDPSDGLSLLERDCVQHWPKESAFLPESAADEKYGTRKAERYVPMQQRQSLFRGALFVHMSVDDLNDPWRRIIEHAQGRCMKLSCAALLDTPQAAEDVQKAVLTHLSAASVPDGLDIYLWNDAEGLPPLAMQRMHASVRTCGAKGLVTLADIGQAIYQGSIKDMGVEPDPALSLPEIADDPNEVLAHPTPSATAARTTLEPEVAAKSGHTSTLPVQSVGGLHSPGEGMPPKSGARVEADISTPPSQAKKKLIRRAGQKQTLLEALFGDQESSPFPRVAESQETSLGPTQQPHSGSRLAGSAASLPVGTSRTARLVRRAGQAVRYDFNLDGPEEKGSDVSTKNSHVLDIVPNRTGKRKMRSDDVETDRCGVSETAAADVAQRPKKARKGSLVIMQAGTGKKTSRLAETDHQDSGDSKYLQIDRGKKRVTEEEAELNKEFNELKIVKPVTTAPQLPQGRQVGWHERDLDEDEMVEARSWMHNPEKSFFNIVRMPLGRLRPAPSPSSHQAVVSDQWLGRPDFKAFRPKADARQRHPKRAPVDLTISPLGAFGLGEDLSTGIPRQPGSSTRRTAFGPATYTDEDLESESRSALDALDSKSRKDSKRTRSDLTKSRKASTSTKARRMPIREADSEIDESAWNLSHSGGDDFALKSDRASSAQNQKAGLDAVIDDDLTFGGFGRERGAQKRKRK